MKITAYEVRPDEKDYLLAAAQQEQIEITLVQGPMTQDNIDRAEGADGITILGDTKMDAALIEETAKRRIRVVATRTIGYDHIDLNAAKSNGVHVCNGYYDPDGVAEYTVMLILMSLRNYKQALFRGNANDYSLGGLIGRELRNLTVGIIGTGKIGQKVAQNLQGFGCRILAYSRRQNADPALGIEYCSLEELYAKSDIISLHTPLSNQTRYMIDKKAIDQMKDGVVILNYARDLLVNDDDMAEALKSGKVKKYITDFPNAKTSAMEGVIATPHLGASTEESEDNCAKMAVSQVMNYLENGNIVNSVNFPNCDMGVCTSQGRITILHKNIPNSLGRFTTAIAGENVNIAGLMNKSRGEYAYTMLDVDHRPSEAVVESLRSIEGVLRVRVVK